MRLIFLLLLSLNAMAANYKIMVIFSYPGSSWNTNGQQGVKKVFTEKKHRVSITSYVYDNNKIRKNKRIDFEAKRIQKIVNKGKFDGVIIFDDEASEDLLKRVKFNAPVVITGINQDEKKLTWVDKSKVGVILERYPFENSLKMLKRLDKNINEISIMTTNNESSNIILSQLLAKFRSYQNKYHGIKLVNVLNNKNWSSWKKFLTENQKENRALWVLVPWEVFNSSGKEVTIKEISAYFLKNNRLPTIGIVDINKLLGFLASLSVHSEDLGRQAAIQLMNLINHSQRPKVETINKVRFVINKNRAKQLDIKVPIELLELATIDRTKNFDTVR